MEYLLDDLINYSSIYSNQELLIRLINDGFWLWKLPPTAEQCTPQRLQKNTISHYFFVYNPEFKPINAKLEGNIILIDKWSGISIDSSTEIIDFFQNSRNSNNQ